MAKRECVLSDSAKESIEIVNFIFHIIIEDELKPIYLNQVILDDGQIEFFKRRLIDVAQGMRYMFIDKENSSTYDYCQSILEDKSKFVRLSKKLAASFKDHHKGNMSNGVFITSVVKISNSTSYIFLLKIDNRLVYRYKIDENKRAVLEKIKQTFVEDAKAIQKMALISMSEEYSWDVLAYDRIAGDGIGGYFCDFLSVVPKDDIFELTQKSYRAAQKWASCNPNLLGQGETAANYRQRAINYLTSHNTFNSDEFIETVIYYENEEERNTKRNMAIESFRLFLQEQGIYGQSYKISEKALKNRNTQHTQRTIEGLTLSWSGAPESVNLKINPPHSEHNNSDMYQLIIDTAKIIDISK